MSQRSVERAVGKMVTDEAFQERFFEDPRRASMIAGLDLLACEIDALLRVPRSLLRELAAALDDRICRLPLEPSSDSQVPPQSMNRMSEL